MLSPNAMNRVPTSRGGAWTLTLKLQTDETPRLSVAAHVTLVTPGLKGVPEGTVHVTVTGATPPEAVGAP
jgi:hypothetical protein